MESTHYTLQPRHFSLDNHRMRQPRSHYHQSPWQLFPIWIFPPLWIFPSSIFSNANVILYNFLTFIARLYFPIT